mmetsp:Transcript_47443/g.58319  ORF Transcript_47443/g.58319 Transcript_47443/m.58319 type:complete len:136 (-) Transcript_47443:103-510(-)|eukprot:CAMPEP_0114672654 /NCGR_PEP_ID=MMETSP0191-20121206/43270_1 /TAXON_ID=126664 /ORGANISM="Sorites sp." /LENGTH=135 /DNA_ID=CAMNT_0001935505 /DNA_START=103 /DNA_END=510 /DNA_ORIENTATION=+
MSDEVEEVDEKLDFATAMAQVLKDARANDCLARGLREVCKAIESKKAAFVVMADSCNDDKYKKCIQALCKDCKIPRVSVPKSTTLGGWCGLIRTDADKNITKTVGCSSCAVLEPNLPESVKETEAWGMVQDQLKK